MTGSLDIIIRTLATTGVLSLAALFLVSHKRQRAALPGAMLCLAIAAFVVTSAPGFGETAGLWVYPLTALCVTKTAWFWLFSRALFSDSVTINRHHVILLCSIAIGGCWQQRFFVDRFREGIATYPEIVLGFGLDGVFLLLVVLAFHFAWRDLSADLVERRRQLRLAFIMVTGSYLVLALFVQANNIVQNIGTPLALVRVNMLLIFAISLAAAGLLIQLRLGSWLHSGKPRVPEPLNRLESGVLTRLTAALESGQLHRRPGLTIGSLADQLGTREHILRKVINRGMGHRNFNEFLNHWRIQDACDTLAMPEAAKRPVLTIAMDLGYGSVGAFNRAFKARTGLTPTEYRQKNLFTA